MRDSNTAHTLRRLAIFMTIFGVVGILPLLSKAQPSTSVNIVNNSNRSIRYVYLSHVNADDWSADQLHGNTIGPGQSFSMTIACDSSEIKLVGEDADGCFLTGVVSCGGSATWTITSSTPADCGQ